MNRRAALKAFAAAPLLALPLRGRPEHTVFLDEASHWPEVAVTSFRYPIHRETTILREGEEMCSIQDPAARRSPGTVYTEFYEIWQFKAEMTGDPATDKANRHRLLQQRTGKQFRVIDVVNGEDMEGKVPVPVQGGPLLLTLGRPDSADLLIVEPVWFRVIRLKLLGDLHIWHTETEFVIADSAQHAAQLYRNMLGHKPGDPLPSYDESPEMYESTWKIWPDDKPFKLTEEVDEEELPVPGAPIFTPYDRNKFDSREHQAMEACTAPVSYVKGSDGLLWSRTTRRLPQEWVKELGAGYLASTEG